MRQHSSPVRKLIQATAVALLLLAGLALTGTGPTAVQAAGDHLPSPSQGGPTPTITVSPTSGYAGETITVSGMGVNNFDGVFFAWVLADSTRAVAETAVNQNLSYTQELTIPDSIEPGQIQICTAVTGSAQAEFACEPFTVETPPPGSLIGQLPLDPDDTISNADLNLYNELGDIVATTPISPDGSYDFGQIAPGSYEIGAVGDLPSLVDNAVIEIQPAAEAIADLDLASCSDLRTVQISATPTERPSDGSADFGTYLSLGSSTEVFVQFSAEVQTTESVSLRDIEVEFEITEANGNTRLLSTDDNPPFNGSLNISTLSAGIAEIRVTPTVDAVTTQECQTMTKTIKMIPNPLENTQLFDSNTQISWDASDLEYTFDGQVPTLGGLLPLTFPENGIDIPSPINKTLHNRFNAGLLFTADLDLSGQVSFRALRAGAKATVFSNTVFDEFYGLQSANISAVHVDPQNIRSLAVDYGPHRIAQFQKKTTLFSGIIFTAGPVDARVSIKLNVQGELVLEGTFKPLRPAFDTVLTGRGNPELIGSLIVDAKVGRVSGSVIPNVLLEIPVRIATQITPAVQPQQPCVQLGLDVRARVQVKRPFKSGYNTIWSKRENIVSEEFPNGCNPNRIMQRDLAVAPEPARILPAPDVATGPTGEAAAVYVTDTTPDADVATTAVGVRFWDETAQAFGDEILITDGSRHVADPVIAFVGDSGEALAVWTQNNATNEQAEANEGDLSALMNYQDIMYAHWDGSAWSSPQYVTDDGNTPHGDGLADIEGSLFGATLAWSRDTDGDLDTDADGRIAVRNWDTATDSWDSRVELNGYSIQNDDTALNYQVAVDRVDEQDGTSWRSLAWTADKDADLTTNDDRRLAIAESFFLPEFGRTWTITTPVDIPVGADSPDIALLDVENNGYDRTDIGFLMRNGIQDGDETTDIGQFANTAQVWRASKFPSEPGWFSSAILDEIEQPVTGTAPQLTVNNVDESTMAFRRFGPAGTTGRLGQMALVKGFAPPLYVTDDLNQHWLPSLTLNPTTGDTLLLNISQDIGAADLPAQRSPDNVSTAALPGRRAPTFSPGAGSTLQTLQFLPEADPALDPQLALSQKHAAPGATVAVTATVRNLGLAESGDLAVEFYEGDPQTGTLLGTQSLSFRLAFNRDAIVSQEITVAGGPQQITAHLVVQTGGDSDPANNQTSVDLGQLPPPTNLDVQVSGQFPDALRVTWTEPQVSAVAGYRVLRSTTSGGPYELVGETTAPLFEDFLIEPGTTYFYVVETFDDQGVRSAVSPEVSFRTAMERVLLPSILNR